MGVQSTCVFLNIQQFLAEMKREFQIFNEDLKKVVLNDLKADDYDYYVAVAIQNA